jgi:hypothetical protein
MSYMEKVLLVLFGHKPNNTTPQPRPKFKSTFPKNQPHEQDWKKEFNVGMLWDRKIVYMD